MLEVPKDVMRAERAVLQRILKAPYNSFTNSALFNLRMWGGPKFVSIFVLNQAARLRYWKSAEPLVGSLLRDLGRALDYVTLA
eukprot:2051936-Karenia_brevis.AAC.1